MRIMRFSGINLSKAHQRIRQDAVALAGDHQNVVNRSLLMHSLYLDSKGNCTFPELVAHGGLFSKPLFESPDNGLGRILYFAYSRARREKKLEKLRAMCQKFLEGNRNIFIEAYTAYYFSKLFGKEAQAKEFVEPALLAELNKAHQATEEGRQLSEPEKRQLFKVYLQWEQKDLVAPFIQEAFNAPDLFLLKWWVKRPWVKLAYFSTGEIVHYRNLNNLQERIRQGLKIYEKAVKAGWEEVSNSLNRYTAVPKTMVQRSQHIIDFLKERMALIQREVTEPDEATPIKHA